MAARRFGWVDGEEPAGAGGRAWVAHGWPSARDAAGDPALCAIGCRRRMAAHDTDRGKSPRHRLRSVSSCQPAPSKGAGADIEAAINKLRAAKHYKDHKLAFLKDFEYDLGESDLIPFGAAQYVYQLDTLLPILRL